MQEIEALQKRVDSLAEKTATLAAARPVELNLAIALLERAMREREDVAKLLCQRVQDHLQRAEAILNQIDQGLSEHPEDSRSENPLRALLKELGGAQHEDKTPPKSEFEQKLDEQFSRLSGVEIPATPAATHPHRQELRAAKQLRLEQRHQLKKQKVRLALDNRPENPGPLNPQMLAVKILSELQDISPDYLERLVSYMDTLSTLEQQYAAQTKSRAKKGAKRSGKRKS